MANKLELSWLNKDKRVEAEPRILVENPELSYSSEGIDLLSDDITDNLLIHGDNLLGLKALETQYSNKIKCIYIDPPYNTGSAFETYDDNVEHSTWLSLMRERLVLLHKLLRDDGSLWISIDDDEHAYLKVLCDEIFCRSNYVSSIAWQKRISPDMRAIISDAHEYILIYAKNKEQFKLTRNLLPLQNEQLKTYSNPDNDPRGPWTSTPCHAQAGHGTASQFYELTAPNGKKHNPPAGRCWLYTEPVMKQKIEEGKIWFGKDGNGVPRKKTYLSESKGVTPWTWWVNTEVGTSLEGKKESQALFGVDKAFPTPKPERLIERILTIASNEGDIVLDSFLGSGTTAAVAHKMHRRWIGIEMEDVAYSHCKYRLDKVINNEDKGGITQSTGWNGGGGYKFYELAPTLINEDTFGQPVINKQYNPDMLAAAIAIHEGFKYEPELNCYWKQSKNDNNTYLYVTTKHVNEELINSIKAELKEDEFLILVCKSFDENLKRVSKNITIKKIPQSLLKNCEFGVDNYNLNIVCPPEYEEEDE